MIFKVLMLSGILLFASCNAICQIKQPDNSCGKDCCKDNKKSTFSTQSNSANVTSMTTPKKKNMTCKLTSPELQKRKAGVIASLKSKLLKREELPDGYAYLFTSADSNIDEVTAFIKTERICCDFFSFNVSIEDGNLWLSITGAEGAKDFIDSELDL